MDDYKSPRISEELGSLSAGNAAERNPLSGGYAGTVLSGIDGVDVETLALSHGTPLFVFSERTIRAQARAMRTAFKSRYETTQFFWSFKTNGLNAVCQVFKSEGWGAEIVSKYEYDKARALGFDGREIIFNGPYKDDQAIETALREGAMIQIDNWDDMARVERAAEGLGGRHKVGIRVWFATSRGPTWSKFGFGLASGEALRAATHIARHPNLTLHTLHAHIGTYMLDPEAYRVATQSLLGLRDQIEADTSGRVACLNLGGGFPSRSLLHGMTGPADLHVPPIDRYAEAITSELNRLPKARRPILRLETGRHLIDEAGYLVTTVVSIKDAQAALMSDPSGLTALRIKELTLHGHPPKASYVLDAGINLLYTAAWFAISASPARNTDAMPEPARLVGDLCMEIDVIREEVQLPRLNLGDRLTLWPVGAYNLGQSMQFIHLRPAVVLLDLKGGVHVIRRQEELADMTGAEQMPAYLAGRGDD